MGKIIILESPERTYIDNFLGKAQELHSKKLELFLVVQGPSQWRSSDLVVDEILQHLKHVDYDFIYVLGWTIKDFVDRGYPLITRYKNSDFNEALSQLIYESCMDAYLIGVCDKATDKLEDSVYKRHDAYYRHIEFYKSARKMEWQSYLNVDLLLLHGIRRVPTDVKLKNVHLT